MRSPAHAIAWEFGRWHRIGLMALAGYALVLAAIKLLILEPGRPLDLANSLGLSAVAIVPLATTFMYFLAVFSFGLAGDLAARQSIFPARMFTLPVTTSALVGWPMLYGTAAMASLWLATAVLARWLSGIDLPFIWPALLAAAFLAWLQALMWMPYGLPGLRVIVAVPWLAALDVVVFLAIEYKIPEHLMVAFFALQLPLAYLAARSAVGRARRGDVPDWRWMFGWLGRIAGLLQGRRNQFSSPGRAQMWFEWRRHGRSLPAVVGILLPFELALLFVASNNTPGLVYYTLLGVLFTPPFMAGFAAATAGKPGPDARDSRSVSPFDATRPLTSGALIAARLKAAIGSTLLAWLLVVIAIPLALTLSGTWPTVSERTRQWIEAEGMLRVVATMLLEFLALVGLTWKQLVQNLYIGLTGREWVVKASVVLALSYLIIIGPVAGWLISLFVMALISGALLWIAAALVGLKVSAVGWIATRLRRQRLVSDRMLVTIAACWLVVVIALYGLLAWLVTTPLIPRYLLALVAVLAIPLARPSAAPLALAWNRHR